MVLTDQFAVKIFGKPVNYTVVTWREHISDIFQTDQHVTILKLCVCSFSLSQALGG